MKNLLKFLAIAGISALPFNYAISQDMETNLEDIDVNVPTLSSRSTDDLLDDDKRKKLESIRSERNQILEEYRKEREALFSGKKKVNKEIVTTPPVKKMEEVTPVEEEVVMVEEDIVITKDNKTEVQEEVDKVKAKMRAVKNSNGTLKQYKLQNDEKAKSTNAKKKYDRKNLRSQQRDVRKNIRFDKFKMRDRTSSDNVTPVDSE